MATKKLIKRTKREINRATLHKSVDRVIDRIESLSETCSVSFHLYFSEGGIRNSRINYEYQDFIKKSLTEDNQH